MTPDFSQESPIDSPFVERGVEIYRHCPGTITLFACTPAPRDHAAQDVAVAVPPEPVTVCRPLVHTGPTPKKESLTRVVLSAQPLQFV